MEGKSFLEKIEQIKMPLRWVILVGTVVLLAAVFFFTMYKPKTEEAAQLTNNIGDINRRLTRAKIERKKLPKRRAEKEKIEAQFKEALKLLPNSKEIPKLLRKITELGNDSELDFRVFRPKAEKSREFYVEIPVAIEVRGTYHNVAIFFDRVGHMERIMNINNVSMKPIKARSTTLVVTCDAVTYRFKGQ